MSDGSVGAPSRGGLANRIVKQLTTTEAIRHELDEAVTTLAVDPDVPELALVTLREGEHPVLLLRQKPDVKQRKKTEVQHAAALLLGAHLCEPSVKPFLSDGLHRSPINVISQACGYIVPADVSLIPANQYQRGNIARHSMGKSTRQKTEQFDVTLVADMIEVKTGKTLAMKGGFVEGNDGLIRWLQSQNGDWDEVKLLENTKLTACHHVSHYDGFLQSNTQLELTVVKEDTLYRGFSLGAVVWFEASGEGNTLPVAAKQHGNAKHTEKPYVRRDTSVIQGVVQKATEGQDRSEIVDDVRRANETASVAEMIDTTCVDNALKKVPYRKKTAMGRDRPLHVDPEAIVKGASGKGNVIYHTKHSVDGEIHLVMTNESMQLLNVLGFGPHAALALDAAHTSCGLFVTPVFVRVPQLAHKQNKSEVFVPVAIASHAANDGKFVGTLLSQLASSYAADPQPFRDQHERIFDLCLATGSYDRNDNGYVVSDTAPEYVHTIRKHTLFEDIRLIACEAHLKQNVGRKLTSLKVNLKDQTTVRHIIFGQRDQMASGKVLTEGLVHAADVGVALKVIEPRLKQLLGSAAKEFLKYLNDSFVPTLEDRYNERLKQSYVLKKSTDSDIRVFNNTVESGNRKLSTGINDKRPGANDLILAHTKVLNDAVNDVHDALQNNSCKYALTDTFRQKFEELYGFDPTGQIEMSTAQKVTLFRAAGVPTFSNVPPTVNKQVWKAMADYQADLSKQVAAGKLELKKSCESEENQIFSIKLKWTTDDRKPETMYVKQCVCHYGNGDDSVYWKCQSASMHNNYRPCDQFKTTSVCRHVTTAYTGWAETFDGTTAYVVSEVCVLTAARRRYKSGKKPTTPKFGLRDPTSNLSVIARLPLSQVPDSEEEEAENDSVHSQLLEDSDVSNASDVSNTSIAASDCEEPVDRTMSVEPEELGHASAGFVDEQAADKTLTDDNSAAPDTGEAGHPAQPYISPRRSARSATNSRPKSPRQQRLAPANISQHGETSGSAVHLAETIGPIGHEQPAEEPAAAAASSGQHQSTRTSGSAVQLAETIGPIGHEQPAEEPAAAAASSGTRLTENEKKNKILLLETEYDKEENLKLAELKNVTAGPFNLVVTDYDIRKGSIQAPEGFMDQLLPHRLDLCTISLTDEQGNVVVSEAKVKEFKPAEEIFAIGGIKSSVAYTRGSTFERLYLRILDVIDSEPLTAAFARCKTEDSNYHLNVKEPCDALLFGRGNVGLKQLTTTEPTSFPGLNQLNKEQSAALKMAVKYNISAIQGPPGTGKTAVATQIAANLVRLEKHKGPILLTAFSNHGTIALAKAFAAALPKLQFDQINFTYVVSHMSRTKGQLEQYDVDWVTEQDARQDFPHFYVTDDKHMSRQQLFAKKEMLRKGREYVLKSAHVIAATMGMASSKQLSGVRFRTVIMDEAGQVSSMNSALVLTKGCDRFVAIGDCKQLGPFHMSTEPSELVSKSIMKEIEERYETRVMLKTQFRMHPFIGTVISSTFYDGELVNGTAAETRSSPAGLFPDPLKPALIVNTNRIGRETKVFPQSAVQHTQSYCTYKNEQEAECVVQAVRRMVDYGVSLTDIAVITLYDGQRAHISNRLQSQMRRGLEVVCCDSFQGREKDYVIVSGVRSTSPGFSVDPRRVNVAMSRARKGLIMFLDSRAFGETWNIAHWKNIIGYFDENKCINSVVNE